MPRPKGYPKTGGIKKGQTHKNSMKKFVRDIIEDELGKSIPERICELAKGKDDEVWILIDLMPYCYPKLQATEVTAEVTANSSNEELKELVSLLQKMNADN